jgi:hypothetical protein
MVIAKSKIEAALERLPEEIESEELFYILRLLDAVAEGMHDAEMQRIYSHNFIMTEAQKWLNG